MLSLAPMRNRPGRRFPISPTAKIVSFRNLSIRVAWWYSTSPTSVSRYSCLFDRSNRGASNSRSSLLTALLTAGWVRNTRSAAARTLPSSTTATNISSCLSSIRSYLFPRVANSLRLLFSGKGTS
jgi:hypothetical protein